MSAVAAIVLAAGRGTRFGDSPKLLADFGGKPLVRHVVEAALGSPVSQTLVVVGHREAEIRHALSGLGATVVPNPDHAAGLSTSLKAGFAALPRQAEAAIVLLADMPLVSADLIGGLVSAWEEHGRPDAVVPVSAGRHGNPVLLSRRLAPEIARLEGDVGAGPLLRDRPGVVELPMEDAAVTLDVDTPKILAELRQASTTPSSTAE